MNERLGREVLRQAKSRVKQVIYGVLSWSYTHFKCIQIFCFSQWSLLNFVIHFLCFTTSFIMSLFYVLLFYLFEKIALRPVSCVAKCLQPCLWQGCLQRKSLEPWNTKFGRQTTEHHSVIKKKKSYQAARGNSNTWNERSQFEMAFWKMQNYGDVVKHQLPGAGGRYFLHFHYLGPGGGGERWIVGPQEIFRAVKLFCMIQ